MRLDVDSLRHAHKLPKRGNRQQASLSSTDALAESRTYAECTKCSLFHNRSAVRRRRKCLFRPQDAMRSSDYRTAGLHQREDVLIDLACPLLADSEDAIAQRIAARVIG